MIGAIYAQPQLQKTEPLTREEEYDLIIQAKAGNQRALRQLIEKNKGLIRQEANRKRHQADWSVLIAAGEWGVFKAVQKFNLLTGNRFSTYAVPAIHSEIRDCVCRETGVGRTTSKNLAQISRATSALSLELGRDPTLEEISQRSRLTQNQIRTAWEKQACSQPASLNQRFENSSLEWVDLQVDETVDVWRTAEDGEILGVLDQFETNGHLEDRQVTMLIAKYQGYSNKDVGRELGVSGERIRQLVKSAETTINAFRAGTLKLIKRITPVSTPNIEPIGEGDQLSLDLPVPEETTALVMKRVDASRLGGRIFRRIGKVLQKISKLNFANGDRTLISPSINAASHCNDSKQSHNGGQVDVEKHLLATGGGSDHWFAHDQRDQLTSENQRRRELGRAWEVGRRHLGFRQAQIVVKLLQQFTAIGQCKPASEDRENLTGGWIGGTFIKFYTRTKEYLNAKKSEFGSDRPRKAKQAVDQKFKADDCRLPFDNLGRMEPTKHHRCGRSRCPADLSYDRLSRETQARRNLDGALQNQNSPDDRIFPSQPTTVGSACRISACGRHLSLCSTADNDRARTEARTEIGDRSVSTPNFLQPFVGVCRSIRGFVGNFLPKNPRENIHLFATNVFHFFGINQRVDRARPPDEYQDKFSLESDSFISGGTTMILAHKKATAFGLGLIIFAALLCCGLVNDNWSRAPETLRPLSTYDWATVFKDSGKYDSFSEDRLQFLVLTLVLQSKFLELAITAGWLAWSCGYLALLGMNLIPSSAKEALPSKEEA
ncbi:MAG: sigma-70 family RNA polymerase sigma factor [Acaryochloris sp. CRU_2_0]|nr:sigma-70 family RNA polymerase sigma factor [Acaryochloris sp. CRU_2_0]